MKTLAHSEPSEQSHKKVPSWFNLILVYSPTGKPEFYPDRFGTKVVYQALGAGRTRRS